MPTAPTDPPDPEIRTPIRPDASDERDHFYEGRADSDTPRPDHSGYDVYRHYVGTTWHQRGEECTGFALAAIANYLIRRQLDDPTLPSVSRRMMYEQAQIHDGEEWAEASTLRGALKGWQRTGVASDELWPYDPDDEFGERHGALTLRRVLDARHRPLLTYRRIMHRDVELMKDALSEGHALFVGAQIHVGWNRLFMPEAAPVIERRPDDEGKGGHAFVIVGYDEHGFWVHNSWGPEWGVEGYAVLPYHDWEVNGHDAWVVDVGRARANAAPAEPAVAPEPTPDEVAAYRDLWPHLVVLRDDGTLSVDGLYEMDKGSVGTLMWLFQERTASWSRRRLVVYSDSGALPTTVAIERYRQLRDRFMDQEIYPIFVVWETPWLAGLADELDTWTGLLADGELQLPLDRGDPLVRSAVARSVARPIWAEVVRRAHRACERGGGASFLAAAIAKKRKQHWFDLHLAAHGAGDLLQAELLRLLPPPVATATSVVPSTPTDEAARAYRSSLDENRLQFLDLVTLAEDDEQRDRVGPVRGSLLHVVDELLTDRPTGSAPAFGTSGADRSVFEPFRSAGRFVHEVRAADGHHELGWDPVLWDRMIATMRAHETAEPVAGPAGPTAPGWSRPTGAPGDSLPSDPLAYAEAMRERSRRG